ncbi:MAG: hypothetical protein E7258_04380 [Lachnospiraceae bacterium]|nr:hypothetical protein [Lachnospiraceae bacterium]
MSIGESYTDSGGDESGVFAYTNYYNKVLLLEQPFYRSGMTTEEAKQELEYLNNNLQSFYEGNYKPLWKQSK